MAFSIPERFRLLSPHCVTREIAGESYVFYPCSLGAVARMATLIQKLSGHLATLLIDDSKDRGVAEENYTDEGGTFVNKRATSEASLELASLRTEQRRDAVQGAVDALLDPDHRISLGKLVMNSLREDFPRGREIPADVAREFVESMDLPVFVEFLRGLAEANTKTFGDLGKRLRDFLVNAAPGLVGAAGDAGDGSPEEMPETAG